jgi:hypothetical protein
MYKCSFCRLTRCLQHLIGRHWYLPVNWRPFIRWPPDQWVSQCYAIECDRSFYCALFCVFRHVWVNVQSAWTLNNLHIYWSGNNSVGIEITDFSLILNVHTGSGAHPNFFTICACNYFPGVNQQRCYPDNSHSSRAEIRNRKVTTPFPHTAPRLGDYHVIKITDKFTFNILYIDICRRISGHIGWKLF